MERFNHTDTKEPRNHLDPVTKSYSLNGKIMLCSVILLFVVVILIVCFHGYARWMLQRRHRRRQAQQHRSFLSENFSSSSGGKGLDLLVLKAIPTFTYTSGRQEEKVLECAVCLSEFEDGEEGRVLPNCKHAFHIECIDMWFHSHSSCPLCRAPVQFPEGPETALPRVQSAAELASSSEPGRKPLELVGIVVEG